MDDFEIRIKKALKKEVEKPLSYDYAIKNALNKKEETKIKYILKISTITCSLLIISTVVIAMTNNEIYEKIWKKPVEKNTKQEENMITKEITDEEKSTYISKENAIKIGNEIIKKLGYKETKITNVELKRVYNLDYSGEYILRADNLLLNINPITGKLEYFGDNSVNTKKIKCDNISEGKAKEIAKNIYEKLGLFNDKEYEIVNVEKVKMGFGENINEFWQVSFGKIYHGNYDKNNISTICFLVSNGKTIVSTITAIQKDNFENNPIILTKEEAIEIAKNKEKEFSNLEISEITAELSIENMNIFIYCLENNITNENGELKVDDISRNVWVINIKHEKEEIHRKQDINTVKKFYNKKYFIDATTGEIIGGKQSEFFDN